MCTEIAGSVPTWTSLQVLESKVRVSKNAEECPYLVDARCPNAGTRLVARVQHIPGMMRILFPSYTLKISSHSDSRYPRMAGDLGCHALFRVEGNGGNWSQWRTQSSPSSSGLHIEQLSKSLRR